MRHTIYSERVVLGRGRELTVGPARIAWDQGIITSVTTEGAHLELATEARDLGSRWVAPGLVNAHTHLPMHALRGVVSVQASRGNLVEDLFFRLEAALQPGDVRAFARIAAMECLQSGTTSVFEHYYAGEELAAAFRDVGLTGVIAPTLQDLGGPGVADMEAQLQTTLDLHFSEGAARDGLFAALGPHATDTVSGPLWTRLAALAREHDLPVHAHLAQSPEEVERVYEREGCTPGEWLARLGLFDEVRGLWVHGLYLTRAELEGMVEPTTWMGFCPASQAQFDFPAPVELWRRLGAQVVLGTDCGASADGMDVQRELASMVALTPSQLTHSAELAAWQRGEGTLEAVRAHRRSLWDVHLAQADPAQLLSHVWDTPSRWCPALGAGAIEVGARANLIVLDPEQPSLWPGDDPVRGLAYGRPAAALWGVVRNGLWLGEPGDPTAALREPDWQSCLREATRRRRLWLERAGLSSGKD